MCGLFSFIAQKENETFLVAEPMRQTYACGFVYLPFLNTKWNATTQKEKQTFYYLPKRKRLIFVATRSNANTTTQ